MKNFFYLMFICGLLWISVAITNTVFFANYAVAGSAVKTLAYAPTTKTTLKGDLLYEKQQETDLIEAGGDFITDNWGKLMLAIFAFADVVVRLTPSVKDNSILNWAVNLFGLIFPNKKSGGGTF